jgi:outer membrane protein OmpA-like peptidoglycan-associated protein
VRKASFARLLKTTELEYAQKVFHKALPWSQIGITDGLGKGDTVWCTTRSLTLGATRASVEYYINFGDAANHDLSVTGVSLGRYISGYYEYMADVFIHELTHVWQYSRPYAKAGEIAMRCIYAQEVGAGYKFTAGGTWDSYNLEQQASIVEKWNERGRKEDDELFPYIHYLVRKEGLYKPDPRPGADRTRMGMVYGELWFATEANLDTLKMLLDTERMPVTREEPVQVTQKDDSFVVVLTSDVLFEISKADLKAAADRPLEQAWAKIKTNTRRRFIYFNGHTDSTGPDDYNMRLSERRAQSVAQWFLKRGYLTSAVVRPQGFGKTQPVAPNNTSEGRAKNRRVEIYLSNS